MTNYKKAWERLWALMLKMHDDKTYPEKSRYYMGLVMDTMTDVLLMNDMTNIEFEQYLNE